MSKAYTVATLADTWGCSEGVIRKLIAKGELACFRPGTLIRISAEEVRRFECQNIPSNDSGEDMPLSGMSQGVVGATDLRPLTALERKLRQEGFGERGAVHRGPWGGS